MRKAGLILALAALCALPALADLQTFQNVSLVDANCEKKVADNPDAHTRDCALKCEKSGYGIITSDKKFIKFDAAGNDQVATALKASDKKDHLRVDVTGDVNGDSMKVTSVTLR
jgi:hypothetical protein